MTLAAPGLLTAEHDLAPFECGVVSLDDWLRKRALKNNLEGGSRTYVVAEERRVVAYYALSASNVASAESTGRFRRNMPDPVPVALLGRLAVDRAYHGRGFGRALLRDAASRVLHAADTLGIRGMIVQALSEDARRFYLALGFEASPLDPMTLMVTLADLKAAL